MNSFSQEAFRRFPIIGILRGYPPGVTQKIIEAYYEAGLTTIEVTLNSPDAAETIRKATSRFGGRINIGAGTVCSMNELQTALQSGAGFIVTPILNIPLTLRCRELGIPVFPGAYTPTEVYNAWESGATMVKVFPANSLGPDYIRQLKAPLNTIKLLPTGGVDLSNMQEYRNAGADGFGLGSALFEPKLVKAEAWHELRDHFRKIATYWEQINS